MHTWKYRSIHDSIKPILLWSWTLLFSSKDSLNLILFLCLVHFRNNPEFLKDNIMQFFFFDMDY